MDIDYTVAALMFPAIPLMMTMYSNRFHTLSGLIIKESHQNGKTSFMFSTTGLIF
jgi:hypothetical protein